MTFLSSALAALGKRGTEGFALSILLGLALPQFAAIARPWLPVTIFCFMTIVFLRADFGIIAGLIRRPMKLGLSSLWLILMPAVLVSAIIAIGGRTGMDPGLVLGLAILGAAPPIMSSPAIAILYGFEASLVTASVLGVTIAIPLYAPVLVELIAGQAVPLDRSVLMLRLLIFVGGGIGVALVLRRIFGPAKVTARKAELDGFGVLMYFIFAIAAMDGVTAAAAEKPQMIMQFLGIAFALAFFGLVLGMLFLRFCAPEERFILGYATAQRNMGLLVAALGTGVPETTFLFFALAQFPIYILPWVLKPLALRIARRSFRSGAKS